MAYCRQEILNVLQGDWATYIQRYHRLSPQAQSAFLTQQGYARFADLLAHLIAWWRVGWQSVERYVNDPAAEPAHYDVDAFNAKAVAQAAGFEEEQVIASFEEMRHFLIAFVKGLPDAAFENDKVVGQLEMELVGHLREHEIAERESSSYDGWEREHAGSR